MLVVVAVVGVVVRRSSVACHGKTSGSFKIVATRTRNAEELQD